MKNPFVNPVADSLDIANSFSQNDGAYFATDQVRARDADGLKLYDDGGNGIFVKDAGNVGIGTATPDSILSIRSANQNAVVNIYGVASATTDYGVIQVSSVGELTNPQNRSLVLQSNIGNVGIGMTNPSALLNLKGNLSSALTGTVTATNLSTAVVGTGTLFTTELAVGDSIKIGAEVFTVSVITDALNLTLDSAYQGATASGLTAYRDPTLFAIDNGDAINKLIVTRSGNVGIGTTGALGKLQTDSANIPTGGTYLTFGDPFFTSNNNPGGANIGGSISFGGYFNADVKAVFARIQGKQAGIGGDPTGYLAFEVDYYNGSAYVLGEKMRITSTGNVGIGTTSPSSPLDLQKAGTAKANLDILELTNSGNAVDMDGTQTSILFNQWYYDATTPAVADAGRITVGAETDWTSTAATQDSYMSFRTALDGVITEQARVDSSVTAGQTRFLIYDVDNATLERVTVGAQDSGGSGFKVLRIPN